MRFASLGSGSQGNALIVESGGTHLLLDCGFGLSEVSARISRFGLEAGDLDAIIVTHEHGDHGGGVAKLSVRHDIPVYLTRGTLSGLGAEGRSIANRMFIDAHTPFTIGEVEITPYTVPHDAREPVQFVLSDGAVRLGVLTDTGCSTPHITQALSGVNALVLECNHDLDMLMNGPYPAQLKNRIAGRLGHLSNEASAELVRAMDCSRLQHLIAAHLSETNNTPELARAALAGALNCAPEWIGVATQDEGFAWREIT
ncbi:MAG: MBL fold metallo-hydrolase [Betaproteobacteria bacterium]|nr:MBL fold metallo-hydrolase [Betaproteobacteria bacterium]